MDKQVQIGTLLAEITRDLAATSDSPRLDAEILVGRAIDMPRSYLFAHPDDCLDEAAIARLRQTVGRRMSGEPMAYITGIREFWSMELAVTPATLIPRPETELLVDHALRAIPREATWRILDLGTGSGAIALAIARERPLSDVVAVDRSAAALQVAQLNARQLAVPNITFIEGDWTRAVGGQVFDLVLSNPPYVRDDDDALSQLKSEPLMALAAGKDGLDAIRILARDCAGILQPDGVLALEHGAEQSAPVADLLATHGWLEIACHKDYAGLPRVTTARRPAPGHDL